MAANGMKVIALEEGWKQLKDEAIGKLLEQLDGDFGKQMEKPFDHKARGRALLCYARAKRRCRRRCPCAHPARARAALAHPARSLDRPA